MNIGYEGILADIVDLDFRLRWWNQLTIDNPQVAERLMKKWPDRFPIVRKENQT